jgi:hypothetical protein
MHPLPPPPQFLHLGSGKFIFSLTYDILTKNVGGVNVKKVSASQGSFTAGDETATVF